MLDITIRCSSLSQYVDCPRRWAARHLRGVMVAAGFYPRSLASSVGAVIGSGTHSAVAFDLEHKMRTGELAKFSDAVDRGLAELEERIEKEGVDYDEVSQDRGSAQAQVARLARTYREDVGAKIAPIVVEQRMNVRHPTGMIISGQIDNLLEKPNRLRDVKTGKSRGANFGQYGGYSRVLRSHNRPIASIKEDFIGRVALNREQPRVVSIDYDIDTCEMQAEQTIQRIARDYAAFEKTGDREVFAANPASALCKDRFCPAWGTSLCPLGRKA
jgi:hypothetical protein